MHEINEDENDAATVTSDAASTGGDSDVGPSNPSTHAVAPGTGVDPLHPIPPDTLKAAFKAFKKRLKITQLDNDSRVGRSPLTGGRSTVVSISPPNQYPTTVWDALVKDGKLRYAGQGMYELP